MKKISALLLMVASLSFSCNKQLDAPSPTVVTPNSSPITEAKEWFELNIQAKTPTKHPLWDKATVSVKNGKQVVYVPIQDEKSSKEATGERRRLFISTDDSGHKQALLLKLVAEQSYLNSNNKVIRTTDFSGFALVYDWQSGKFIYGNQYTDGNVTGDISEPLGQTAQKGAGTECTVYTITYYSYACANGTCTDPEIVGSESHVVCVNVGGSGSSGGSGSGSGGGGGGGGGGGPIGGGGSGSGDCGDAVICPDGSTNPSLNPDITEVSITEITDVPAQNIGNLAKQVSIKYNTYQRLNVGLEIDTNTKKIQTANMVMSGVTPSSISEIKQIGLGVQTNYIASTNTYYFTIMYQVTYINGSANNGIKFVDGWYSPTTNTGSLTLRD